jgi:hypothetical protein
MRTLFAKKWFRLFCWALIGIIIGGIIDSVAFQMTYRALRDLSLFLAFLIGVCVIAVYDSAIFTPRRCVGIGWTGTAITGLVISVYQDSQKLERKEKAALIQEAEQAAMKRQDIKENFFGTRSDLGEWIVVSFPYEAAPGSNSGVQFLIARSSDGQEHVVYFSKIGCGNIGGAVPNGKPGTKIRVHAQTIGASDFARWIPNTGSTTMYFAEYCGAGRPW